MRETPPDISICVHVIAQPDLFVVLDTRLDPRFANNPLISGEPKLRFYAGALLKSADSYPLGTLCVLDYHPRDLNEKQRFALTALANQVMTQLELLRLHQQQAALITQLQGAQGDPLFGPRLQTQYALRAFLAVRHWGGQSLASTGLRALQLKPA